MMGGRSVVLGHFHRAVTMKLLLREPTEEDLDVFLRRLGAKAPGPRRGSRRRDSDVVAVFMATRHPARLPVPGAEGSESGGRMQMRAIALQAESTGCAPPPPADAASVCLAEPASPRTDVPGETVGSTSRLSLVRDRRDERAGWPQARR